MNARRRLRASVMILKTLQHAVFLDSIRGPVVVFRFVTVNCPPIYILLLRDILHHRPVTLHLNSVANVFVFRHRGLLYINLQVNTYLVSSAYSLLFRRSKASISLSSSSDLHSIRSASSLYFHLDVPWILTSNRQYQYIRTILILVTMSPMQTVRVSFCHCNEVRRRIGRFASNIINLCQSSSSTLR